VAVGIADGDFSLLSSEGSRREEGTHLVLLVR
jgi:hypothetical protein